MNIEETSPLSFKFESMASQQSPAARSPRSGRGSNRSRKSSRRKSIDGQQPAYNPERRKTIRMEKVEDYVEEREREDLEEYSDDYEYVPLFNIKA
ncbi:hypothetical protein QTN25_009864 [Entamoeba marina]